MVINRRFIPPVAHLPPLHSCKFTNSIPAAVNFANLFMMRGPVIYIERRIVSLLVGHIYCGGEHILALVHRSPRVWGENLLLVQNNAINSAGIEGDSKIITLLLAALQAPRRRICWLVILQLLGQCASFKSIMPSYTIIPLGILRWLLSLLLPSPWFSGRGPDRGFAVIRWPNLAEKVLGFLIGDSLIPRILLNLALANLIERRNTNDFRIGDARFSLNYVNIFRNIKA